jgi:hypothetical protein
MSSGQERLANSGWRWRHSVWIIVPPLSFGLLTWAAFLFVGTSAGKRAWQLAAGGYFVALVVGVGAIQATEPEEFGIADAIAMLLWVIVCWLGGTVHAILIRPKYLRMLAASRTWYPDAVSSSGAKWPVAPQSPAVSGDAAHTLGLDKEHARLFGPDEAPPKRTDPPAEAQPPRSSPPQQESPLLRQGQVPGESGEAASPTAARKTDRVPLNAAGEEILATLPGLDPILAKRIVIERQRRGGFDAVEDLADCGVPPHVVVRLRSVLDVDRSASRYTPRKHRGRTLDL